MSTDWPTQKIGDLAADEEGAIAIGPFGSSMKADVYTASGIPVVRGNNLHRKPGFHGEFVFVPPAVTNRFPRCLVRPGDLVFPHRGAIGEVGIVIDQGFSEWMLSTSMMKLRVHPRKLDPYFAFYFFRSPLGRHQLLRNSSQVGTPGISQPLASLRACEIAVPPIGEQRAIVKTLRSLDEKIEQNRRTSQALEALARATFKAWFVDFEPVKAKAAGQTSFPGMPPAAFAALPDNFIDSAVGPVPRGWEVTSLPKLATFLNGLALQKYPARGDGSDLPVIKIAELRKGSSVNADAANINVPEQYIVGDGDLLFSWSGTLEAKRWFGGKGALNQHLFKVTSTRHPLWYVHHAILHHLPEFRAIASSKATTMGHIQRKHLDAALVVVPPESTFRVLDELIGPVYALAACLMSEIRSIAALRDYLLPKLLTGEVRARPTEQKHGA